MNDSEKGHPGYEHSFRYVGLAGAGVLVLLACAFLIDGDHASPAEEAVFHAINGLPGFLFYVMWPFMQAGNLLALPIAAVAALIFRRWRLAAGLVIAVGVKLELAKVVKANVSRHRPGSFLDDVVLRGGTSAGGLAFVSGHAVVAVSIATLTHPYLGRTGRWIVWTIAGLVCFGRLYVGAHLPLDVIGGAGLGLAIGSVLNFALGTPEPSRDD